MKINKLNDINAICFGGMVFMYGNMQVIAEKSTEHTVVYKNSGADSFCDESQEIKLDKGIFDDLIDVIEHIEIETQPSEEDNVLIAIEKKEETGAYEWFVALLDKNEEVIMQISGYNYEDNAFKLISAELSKKCSEFGCIEKFFTSVNE